MSSGLTTPPTTFGPWIPAQNRMLWRPTMIVPPASESDKPCSGVWMTLKMSSGSVVAPM